MFMSRVRIFAALIAAASAAPALAQTEGADKPAAETAAHDESVRIDGAVAFARTMTADATEALTDATVDDMDRLANFRAVLADGMALDVIGRFMIGETRKSMSEEQLARYEELFPPYITRQYAEQFEEIVGKPLEVVDAKSIGARDVIVRTRFDRVDGAPIMVDWRVRKLRSGEHKAIDIIVSGVSIMLVKREEFSSFITANGVDALLDRLEQETAV